jgi:hypothetical protein
MTKLPAIGANQSYTFADYFKLNVEPEEVLSYFGYDYQAAALSLPLTERVLTGVEGLRSRLEESLPFVSLTSEMARREFLIAPVLMELIHHTHAKTKVSYSVMVNDQLKGELDYLLQTASSLIVIEAKNADLQRGFTQLAVELIAIEKTGMTDQTQFYGAVSLGNIWQFALLDVSTQTITQDLNLFRIPTDLSDLLQVLVGILE